MTALRDPKSMAKTLRSDLAAHGCDLSHSQCLEIVAHQLGHADWNTAAAAVAADPRLSLPDDWFIAGSNPHDYDVGIDHSVAGHPVTIRSKADRQTVFGFATLMQSFAADAYHGQRLRLVGELSSRDVAGHATMWMRVDAVEKSSIRFDNMIKRKADGPLRGTNDWTRREIVLDVPAEAEKISYGFFLDGKGQCWCRRFDLEPVNEAVPVTSTDGGTLAGPRNLDFTTTSEMI